MGLSELYTLLHLYVMLLYGRLVSSLVSLSMSLVVCRSLNLSDA